MDPEDNIKLPIIAVNIITVHILLGAHPQDTFSRKLDRLRKSTAQDNQLTRLSHYINTGFPCEKKNLPTDLQEYWNYCYIVGLGPNCKFIYILFKRLVITFIKINFLNCFIVLEIIFSQTDTLTEGLMYLR